MLANPKDDKINFAPNNLTLHRFLATRNSLKNNTKFLVKSAEFSKKTRCKEENQPNAKMRNIYEGRIGKYSPNTAPCLNLRHTKLDRNLFESKSFHLSPNIYNTIKVPFASRHGAGSASWSSLPRDQKRASSSAFNETPRELERLTRRGNKHKGKFLSNIVDRCMVKRRSLRKHVSTVEEETFIMYNPQQHTVAYNVAPPIRTPKPNPHLFLRASCVPEKLMSFLPRHQSFLPAVGRYEVTQPGSHQLSSHKVSKTHNKRKPTSQRNTVLQRSLRMPVIVAIPSKLLADSSATPRHHKPISRRRYKLTSVKPSMRLWKYTPPQKSKLIAKNKENSRRPSTSVVTTRQLVSRLTEVCAHKYTQSNLYYSYKRSFKFLPLPQPKILVRKTDLLPDSLMGEPSNLYFRDIDVNDYLKKEAINRLKTLAKFSQSLASAPF